MVGTDYAVMLGLSGSQQAARFLAPAGGGTITAVITASLSNGKRKYASADKRPSFSMFYLVGVDPRLSVKGHFPQGEKKKKRVKALHPRGAGHVAESR